MVDENTADEAAEPAEAVDVEAAADLDDGAGTGDTVEGEPVEIEEAEGAAADDGTADATDEDGGEEDPGGEDGESPDVIRGIGPAYSSRLADEGITTVAELAAADADEVADSIDVSEKLVSQWIERAREH
jgi:predicted flap endonuclease-1-like 5' DNA nuclease